jgi:hypothetical protein
MRPCNRRLSSSPVSAEGLSDRCTFAEYDVNRLRVLFRELNICVLEYTTLRGMHQFYICLCRREILCDQNFVYL